MGAVAQKTDKLMRIDMMYEIETIRPKSFLVCVSLSTKIHGLD